MQQINNIVKFSDSNDIQFDNYYNIVSRELLNLNMYQRLISLHFEGVPSASCNSRRVAESLVVGGSELYNRLKVLLYCYSKDSGNFSTLVNIKDKKELLFLMENILGNDITDYINLSSIYVHNSIAYLYIRDEIYPFLYVTDTENILSVFKLSEEVSNNIVQYILGNQ